MSVNVIDSGSAFKYLYHGFLSVDLQDLTSSNWSISQHHIDDLSIFWELNIVQNDQWTIDLEDCSIIDSRSNIIVSTSCLNMSLIHYKNILMQGKIFADWFKVEVKLGKGAFGELWQAENVLNKQRVAIKFEEVDLKK